MQATNTHIHRITHPTAANSTWQTYTKTVLLGNDIKEAFIRFETDNVCAVYVNGRYPERVPVFENGNFVF